MGNTRRKKEEPRRRPATTPEQKENQLISYATNLAEKQLKDGTASAQVITHYLKLGSSREKLEQERLKQEVVMMNAKAEQLQSQKRVEELYAEALTAMKAYNGQQVDELPEYDDEED